ncbi:MAG: DUF1289 domain-containing protein [Dechloromonas sp.]|nr:DUF1289 domain-containing protein [Dechloromonas sp.]
MAASPCINLCQMDPANDLCRGCFRTLDEIARWSTLPAAAKTAILAELPARQTAEMHRPPQESNP